MLEEKIGEYVSNKKKGYLTASGEWAKHLREWGKRRFWRGERIAGKEEAKEQLDELEQPFNHEYE